MTKKELVNCIARHSDLTKADAGRALQAFMSVITEGLAKGENVTINGFGTFQVATRAARKGCNPRTGEELVVPARTVAKFRPAKKLAEEVNQS